MAFGNCPQKLWDADYFEACHQQRYLEQAPAALLLLGIAVFWAFKIGHRPRKLERNETPLDDGTVLRPLGAPDTSARIFVRTRGVEDQLRLVGELLVNIGLIAGLLIEYLSPEVREIYTYAPRLPAVLLGLSVYTFLLSVYRFLRRRTATKVFGEPFTQLAYIYTFFTTVFLLRSLGLLGVNAPDSKVYAKTTLGLLILAFLNWVNLFSAPIGDEAARLYTANGSIPSSEPVSSLFRILTCSWNASMILGAVKEPLSMLTVWDLSEDDHVYRYMEKFCSYSVQWSFVTRMIVTTRKRITLNIFFGCVASVMKLLPTLFIQKILQFLELRDVSNNMAWLFVLGLGISYLISNVTSNQAYYQGRKLSLGVRSLIIGCVYRKALFSKVSKSRHVESDDTSGTRSGSRATSGRNSTAGSTVGSDSDLDDSASSVASEIDATAFDTSSNGAVINLMSIDAFKVADTCSYLHEVIATPFLVFMSVFFLYGIIGWSAFVALLSMIMIMPLNVFIAKRLNKVQDQLMAVTDKRVEKTNELLEAVRIVKFYAWERRFTQNVFDVRSQEITLLLWRSVYWIANSVVFFLMPMVVVVTSFWCFVRFQGGNLTSSVAFTSISIFNIMRMPLNELAFMLTDLSSTMVSLGRITRYLNDGETPKYKQLKQPSEYVNEQGQKEEFIGFDNATFAWGEFTMKNLDIKFAIGDLNVIVGPTGSGKTSLLLALLGEMPLESGSVYLPHGDRRIAKVDESGLADTVAYCSQEAWLLNDTIKNNITFAADFDKKRYKQVLKACQMERDLEILEHGDQTFIGDKGIALSGGQKQRVCLARALYSNSKHIILDDCLSAVDSHTAEGLYNEALTGPLALNRTVILVSHNVALTIAKAALVVVLENGRVTQCGPPGVVGASGVLGADELVSRSARLAEVSRSASQADLAALIKNNAVDQALAHGVDDIDEVEDVEYDEEERAIGHVPLKTYMTFLRTVASKRGIALALLFAVLVPISEYVTSWWTKVWAGDVGRVEDLLMASFPRVGSFFVSALTDNETLKKLRYYSSIYLLIGSISTVLALAREFVVYYAALQASKRLFERLLVSVVNAKTRFFDCTPNGRIMNRFSKDMEVVDQEIGANLLWLLISVLDALQVAMVVSWVTPLLLPVAVLVLYEFVVIARNYLAAARDLKRLESVTRSPIFQQFGETLTGAVVIRAYDDARRFVDKNWGSIDYTHRPYFWLWVSNRWLSFWCSMLSLAISVSAASCIVYAADIMDPGMAGISLSFSTYFGECILWIVRMYAQCEVSMNSVERIYEYLDIEQEAPGIIPESRPPANWPDRGEIEFKNLSLRYNDNLPLVIKNVSFNVEGGEKIGVVGRTGAGKSTIITAMFRILEPATGSITIDGIDISTIGLEDLRTNLSIIPQDPTLFKGTLRSNLDLFNEYSDVKIFEALASVQLVPKGTTPEIARLTYSAGEEATNGHNVNLFYNLDLPIVQGGQNLSQGQRQLLCLARAILREPRILLLDEATASIDYATDSTIQKTIRKSFVNTTILTIAHRLRTIADYDKILVLDKGCVAEYDHPAILLRNQKGLFYGMCAKSGELDVLAKIAEDALREKTERTEV